ncbi:polysaccharide pyruvyl transferase family protein [uncultured Lacticaseibacillus sp.]|uniref:polysaccharide pyruvyl transferase family protein n=1 Tax=uncultured Lacticaseibacillus sp. TaxID=2775882 RepID=UPI0025956B70|nr:polysaccharide pyruvyl transferase family protein [uncultured Lacticaseibacillus sp.]
MLDKYGTVLLFDTSVVTENLGDFIIMDAVRKQLRSMFPDSFFVNTPTHDVFGPSTKAWASQADYKFVGGTNLLTNRFRGRSSAQWRFGIRDTSIKDIVGVGLGWQSDIQYDRLIDVPLKRAQSLIYNRSLSKRYLHSVRDSFTQNKLSKMGIESINTACVTMWELTPEHLEKIPKYKQDTVVTTITNYWHTSENLTAYKKLLELLLDNYSHVKLWIQAKDDLGLFRSLNIQDEDRIELIPPSLDAYDAALSEQVDYIGTRLHAGIRALQHGRRTLIVQLDNRAREIARDTNLSTMDYRDLSGLSNFINTQQPMDIHVPFDQIKLWKSQFI